MDGCFIATHARGTRIQRVRRNTALPHPPRGGGGESDSMGRAALGILGPMFGPSAIKTTPEIASQFCLYSMPWSCERQAGAAAESRAAEYAQQRRRDAPEAHSAPVGISS